MKMSKPAIVYFGTPQFSVTVLKALRQVNHPIVGVVTTPDRPKGRKGTLTPSPVKQYAQKNGLKLFDPTLLKNNAQFVTELETLSPTLFVVFSYGKIIPDELLAIPTKGAINIHPSLLPKYRGPSPVQWQILHGETETGISIIQMTNEVDAGPIIFQQSLPLPQNATFQSLITTLSELSANVINSVILDYNDNKISIVQQDESQATFTKTITKQDGFIDSADLASINTKQFDQMVRAYYPWPTVWTKWHGKILKFLPEKKIQIEGKVPVPVKEFLNGYPAATTIAKHLFGQ